MMRILLFALTSLISFSSVAQSDSTEKSKWSIGLGFSPDYIYRVVTSHESSADLVKKWRDSTEISSVGGTVSISLAKRMNRHWDMLMGVQLSRKGYQTKEKILIMYGPDPSVPADSGDHFFHVYKFHYVSFPFGFRYHTAPGMVFFSGSAAAALDLPIGGKFETYFVEPGTGLIDDIRAELSLSLIARAGIHVKINRSFEFLAEPVFSIAFLTLNWGPVTQSLYSAGALLSLNYRF